MTNAPRRNARLGFTLTEVMIAIMLTAVFVTSVFGVALTAKRGSAKYEHKIAAKNAATMVLNQLQNYVTAAQDSGSGPNQGCGTCAGASTWTLPLPGDPCGGCLKALDVAGSNCVPAAPGCHDVTALLPAKYRSNPYQMKMSYQVTDTNGAACPDATGLACSRLKIHVKLDWQEP